MRLTRGFHRILTATAIAAVIAVAAPAAPALATGQGSLAAHLTAMATGSNVYATSSTRRVQVSFEVGDIVASTQIVRAGDSLAAPAPPTAPAGKVFDRWELGETDITPYLDTVLASADLTQLAEAAGAVPDAANLVSVHAKAVFADAHAVRFHQYTREECAASAANAQVYCYSLLTSGRANLEAASLSYVPLVEGVDAELVGWEAYGEGDEPTATYDKAAAVEGVTADLDLYPKLSSGFWVSLSTGEDAPLLENVFVTDDGSGSGTLPAASLPTEESLAGGAYNPETHTYVDSYRGWYQGWVLEGWYQEEALVNKVEGDLTLVGDKTLYAHWTPRDDTTYTIANMVEDGTGTPGAGAFSLANAVVMTGTSGDATGTTDSAELVSRGYHIATAEELAGRSDLDFGAATIAGDGTSVKYQYWFRNWYHVRFYTGNRKSPGSVYLDAPKIKWGESVDIWAGSQTDYVRSRFQYSDGQFKGVYMVWSGASVNELWKYECDTLLNEVRRYAPHTCTIIAYYDAGNLTQRRGIRYFTTLTGDEDPSQEVSTATFATGTYDFVKTEEYWEWGAHNRMDVNTVAKSSRRGYYTLGYRYASGIRDVSTATADHAYINEAGVYEADTNAYWKTVWQARNSFELSFANVDGVLADTGKPYHYDEVVYGKRLESFFPFTSTDTLRKVGNTIYRFKGWYSSLYAATNWEREESAVDLVDPVSVTMPAATTTYYAAWEPLSYELVFDANGGEMAPVEGATLSDDKSVLTYTAVEGGKLIDKPAMPTKTVGGVDYTFVGWYRDEALTKAWDFGSATLQGPVRLYAKWVKGRTYTVSYHDAGGTEMEGLDETRYRYGASVATVPEQPDETQTEPFLGWSLVRGNAAYVVGQSFTVSSNTDLFAVYGTAMPGAGEGDVEAGAPVLTLESNYPAGVEGHVSQTLQVARVNAAVTLPAALAGAEAPGYHVAGWTTAADGGDEFEAGGQVAVAEDTTLYARWEANQLSAEIEATPVYDGQPHRPEPSVVGWDGSALVASRDYVVDYPEDVTSTGEHVAVVRGLGAYALSEDVRLTYQIAPRPVTLAADNHASRVGEELAELTWTTTPALVSEGDLGTVAASTEADGTEPGSWPINLTYTANANYDVRVVPGTYRVSAATLVVSAQDWSGTYDGVSHTASVKLSPDAAYDGGATVYYSETETLTAGNYLEGTTMPPSRVRAGTTEAHYYVAGTASYMPDEEDATGTVRVSVSPAPLTVTANNKTVTYGDAPVGAGVTLDGLVGGDSLDTSGVVLSFVTRDGSGAYGAGSAVGSYRIVPSGLEAPDYAVTYVPGVLTVSRRTVGLTWSAADSMTYTGTPRTYAGVTATDLFGTDQLSLDVSGITGTDVDDYDATVTGLSGARASNYSLPSTGLTHQWHVTQASNSATVAIDDWTYGSAAAAPTAVAGFGVTTATFEYADTATGPFAATPPTQAGTHYVRAVVPATDNWAGATSVPVAFEVERRQVAITGLGAEGKVYDGTKDVALTGAATLSGVAGRPRSGPVAGDDVSVTVGAAAFDVADAGERTVSFAGYALAGETAGNYELVGQPASVTATISPRPLTVTAPSPTISFGDEPPAYVASFDGFADGEDASVLTGSVTPTCAYEKGMPAKTYEVTAPALVTNGNYDITLVNGTLTVTQAANEASVTMGGWVYGETAATPSATASFGVETAVFEYAESADGTYSTTPLTSAGTHYVRAVVSETSDWAGATSVPVAYEVAHRQVAIAGLGAANKVYDGTRDVTLTGEATLVEPLGVAYSGPVAGDDVSVSAGTASFDNAAAGERTVSFAGYGLSGEDAANYALVAQPANVTATISPRPLMVTAPSPTISFGDEPPAYVADFDGFADGEDASVLTGSVTPTCSYVKGMPADTYVVTAPALVTNGNYDITLVNGTLTVARATNEWVVEPAAASWVMGQAHDAPVGQAVFGTAVLEFAERLGDGSLGPWSADVPATPGDYTMRASVEATGDWTGLEAFVDFSVSYDTLTYDANSMLAKGETAPYLGSTGDEVPAAPCGFTWPRHSFLGWNTAADGSGDAYDVGTPYTLTNGADVLYAQWEPAGELAYDGNGATAGAVEPRGGKAGARVIVSKNAFELPGHAFVEWNTAADGTGRSYAPGDTFVLNHGGDVLYAQWRERPLPASKRPMYRLYNPNSGEHFYTASADERDAVAAAGWRYEGLGWVAPASGDPVYRLYNAHAGDHHYTLSAEERDALVAVGWRYEGVGWRSADPGSGVPLWRQYNPNALAGAHNFTADEREHLALCALGWRGEGIAWYGVR